VCLIVNKFNLRIEKGHNKMLKRTLLILVLLLLSFKSNAQNHKSGSEAFGWSDIKIENSNISDCDLSNNLVKNWEFEDIYLQIDSSTAKAKLLINKKERSHITINSNTSGILLEGKYETSRGDFISAPVPIESFRWVSITVEYEIESGEARGFVCVRPTNDRSQVDLEFLPTNPLGIKRKATLLLHTGLISGGYSISLSILGKGSVRYYSVSAMVGPAYPRPSKPVFVLDMMRDNPTDDGELHWGDADRMVSVFGFPSVEHMHFSKFDYTKLEAIDPAFIIFPPGTSELSFTHFEQILESMVKVAEYPAPVVGICSGHQSMGMIAGVPLIDGSAWGPKKIEILERDLLFDGLPRYPYFYASESHNSILETDYELVDIIASNEECPTQFFRFKNAQWYSFQAHIEREWEYNCPEAYIIFKNMLKSWGLIP